MEDHASRTIVDVPDKLTSGILVLHDPIWKYLVVHNVRIGHLCARWLDPHTNRIRLEVEPISEIYLCRGTIETERSATSSGGIANRTRRQSRMIPRFVVKIAIGLPKADKFWRSLKAIAGASIVQRRTIRNYPSHLG